ncbi:MAG: nitroreductase family protein [Proteobacteria bacterium]|nr:nitroreductase family protein [Pseudomonadota bacterium]
MNKIVEVTHPDEETEKVSLSVPPEPGAPFNQVEDVIYRRRSVRYYKKKQVPEYLVRRIIEAGRFAPSAGNAQPWKFIVIQDAAVIDEMTADIVEESKKLSKWLDYTQPGKAGRSRLVRWLQKKMPNNMHPIPFGAISLIADGKLGTWHGAPTVILMAADMRAPGIPPLDIGIAGQNIVLTANSLGLGTCWMSFVTLLAKKKKWLEKFGIQYPYEIITSIAVGFSRGEPDGHVERETQAIDWFADDGSFKVVY